MSKDAEPEAKLGSVLATTEQISGLSSPSEASSETKRAPRGWRKTIQSYIWDDPDKSPEEKKFLRKLDFFLLIAACYGYFCKNLDQGNINNAYVSGMKEALGMYGSELTYMGNMFTAGYVIGELPAVILATRVRPSYLIPALEICWATVTICCSVVKTVPQIYAMRFLLGLCESAYFPVMVYIISSWYTKEERAKRMALFYCTTVFSHMFSGYLQAAAYNNLGGKLGHAGWQWLFIICGIISYPAGVLGFFFIPDFPENTQAFYLNKEEIEFARNRMLREGFKPLGAAKWDRKKLFRIARQWQFWVLPLGYFFVQGSLPAYQPIFQLWLKAEKYPVHQVNVLPTAMYAIGGITQIVAGILSDSPMLRGKRWQMITVMQAGTFFSMVVLAVWDVPRKLKFVAFYLSYMSSGVPALYYSWFPELIPHDHEMRGFITASSNMFSFIMSIWWTDAVWRTVDAPRFHAGFIASAGFGVAIVTLCLILRYLEKYVVRKKYPAIPAANVQVDNPGLV